MKLIGVWNEDGKLHAEFLRDDGKTIKKSVEQGTAGDSIT